MADLVKGCAQGRIKIAANLFSLADASLFAGLPEEGRANALAHLQELSEGVNYMQDQLSSFRASLDGSRPIPSSFDPFLCPVQLPPPPPSFLPLFISSFSA